MIYPGIKCEHPRLLLVESKKDSNTYPMVVPCQHCRLCRSQRSREWSLRVKMEAVDYKRDEIVFTTLTYDEDHVPQVIHSTRPPFTLKKTLWPRDYSNFMKRLRRRIDYKIRAFGCGEYGERTRRPHLHLVIFGLRREDWPLISDAWGNGFVCNKDFYNETAGYVAQYIQKKLFGNDMYDGSIPPFVRSSQNPSIGENEFWRHAETICKQGFIVADGYKHSIPRTFMKKAMDPAVCLDHGFDHPLLPESDLDELALIRNLQTVEFLEHLDAQDVDLNDYEKNFLSLVKRSFDLSNRTRDYNEVV